MQKLPVPNVQLDIQDQGSVFQAKMNSLANACKSAVQAYNNQIDAVQTAGQHSEAALFALMNTNVTPVLQRLNMLTRTAPVLDLDFISGQYSIYESSEAGVQRKKLTDIMLCERASFASVNTPFGIDVVDSNIPRLDFDQATGELRGLLCEEHRTNILLSTENFTAGGGWGSEFIAVSQTANGRLVESSNNEIQAVRQIVSVPSSVRAFSIYITDITTTAVIVAYFTNSTGLGANRCGVSYNPVTGDVGSFAFGTTNIANVKSSKFYNGIKITFTTTEHTRNLMIAFNRLTTPTYHGGAYQGDGVSGATLKVQFEVGSFPSAYIRADESATTRVSDMHFVDFDTTLMLHEFTLFLHVAYLKDLDPKRAFSLGVDLNNRLDVRANGNTLFNVNGSPTNGINTSFTEGGEQKIAIRYDGAGLAGFKNGELNTVQAIPNGGPFLASKLYVGRGLTIADTSNIVFSRITLFPRALSNVELQEMTRL